MRASTGVFDNLISEHSSKNVNRIDQPSSEKVLIEISSHCAFC